MLSKSISSGFSLVSPSGIMGAGDLKSASADLRSKMSKLGGCCVALQGSPENMLKWLVAFDGLVREIVLVPQMSCEKYIKTISEIRSVDAVMIDDTVLRCYWPKELVVGDKFDVSFKTNAEESVVTESKWLVATSGTTSTPKLVNHTVKTLSKAVAKGGRHSGNRWGLLYDPARFAGIQVVLQAVLGGSVLVVSDSNWSLETQIEHFVRNKVASLSATPTMWRKLMMTKGAAGMPLKQITLGGEASSDAVLSALASMFDQAHITHIYASTEAGVGFAVHDRRQGFPVEWLDTGYKGIGITISESSTLMLRPLVSSQSYIDSTVPLFDSEGWYDTGDLVEQSEGRVIFRGRANGSINVGGNKVMPEDVEQHICQLHFVDTALVQARSSSLVGNLLEAFVVVSDNTSKEELVKTIRGHCSKGLANYKIPAFIKIVDELPMTSAGKTARKLGV